MSRAALRKAVSVALMVGLGAGCAVTVPPTLLQPRAAENRAELFDIVLGRFADMYIEPEAIDPQVMLDGAVDELVATAAGLAFSSGDEEIVLEMAGRRASISRQPADLRELAAALDAVSAWVHLADEEGAALVLQAAALRGAVRAVDRWGNVLQGQRRDALMSRFRGSMAGVGCRIGRRDGVAEVLEVYPRGPASRAGLRAGDRVLAIDGRPVVEETISQIVAQLRGEAGTQVTIRLQRESELDVVELAIERSRFVLPTVSSRLVGGDVGVLRITHISKNSGIAAERVLGGLRESNGLKGIILDLRGNSGGSMLAAGHIADQFVDSGVLIETRGRGGLPVRGLRNRVDATDDEESKTEPALVVLVDSRTGSSAEFLAGALIGHDRALLVGEPTFGKGVIQKTYDLGADEELLLKVTVARAYAAGQAIPESGMIPDVVLMSQNDEEPAAPCVDVATAGADSGPVASVTLPDGGDQRADPQIAFAADLIRRFPALSRRESRRLIQGELCGRAAL